MRPQQAAIIHSEKLGDHITPEDCEEVLQPEQALWLAVLNRAFVDAAGRYHDPEGFFQAEARRWFKSDSELVGSFRWILTICGLEHLRSQFQQVVAG